MWRVDYCFIHGRVFCRWMCQSDVSAIPSRMFLFFNRSFRPCRFGFLTFLCLWEITFSSQMISVIVSWLLGLNRIFKSSYDCFSGET